MLAWPSGGQAGNRYAILEESDKRKQVLCPAGDQLLDQDLGRIDDARHPLIEIDEFPFVVGPICFFLGGRHKVLADGGLENHREIQTQRNKVVYIFRIVGLRNRYVLPFGQLMCQPFVVKEFDNIPRQGCHAVALTQAFSMLGKYSHVFVGAGEKHPVFHVLLCCILHQEADESSLIVD